MHEIARWETDEGPVFVEVDTPDEGFVPVARPSGETVDAAGRFEDALGHARSAAVSALRVFRDRALDADEISLEFGVKLSVAAGAIIARTSADAQLTVKVKWARDSGGSAE